MVQITYPYMTTGKTIALTRWTFAGKVMSLLFNMLSKFVIAFLPRSNHLLISRLQSLSTVIVEPKKIKSVTVSIFSPSISHEVMGQMHYLHFLNVEFWANFFTILFHLHQMLFSSSSLSAMSIVSSGCFVKENNYNEQGIFQIILI